MRLLLILFFVSIQFTNYAQPILAEVNYKNDVVNNSNQFIYYKHSQLLAINNFEKIPEQGTNVIAITNSGFAFKAAYKKETDKPAILVITVTCSFDKTQSWMKPAGQNKYTLNHEQRHFDITYISCALFIKSLRATTFNQINYFENIQSIYKLAIADMGKLQQQYDAETNNGINQQQQMLWNKKIDQLLLSTSF
jgi:hypothetical protein